MYKIRSIYSPLHTETSPIWGGVEVSQVQPEYTKNVVHASKMKTKKIRSLLLCRKSINYQTVSWKARHTPTQIYLNKECRSSMKGVHALINYRKSIIVRFPWPEMVIQKTITPWGGRQIPGEWSKYACVNRGRRRKGTQHTSTARTYTFEK